LKTVSEAPNCGIIYDHNSDYSRGVIYDCNIFIIEAAGMLVTGYHSHQSMIFERKAAAWSLSEDPSIFDSKYAIGYWYILQRQRVL
jgi:hypothetical protein